MKITCQSCNSKYNVADEKVQGKIVKIRCRKCGSTIVVHGAAPSAGNAGAAAADSAPATSTESSQAGSPDVRPWHVNVAENDQRTMTLDELVDAYRAALVNQETFIWTEGMDDWKTLAEVKVVVAAIHPPEPPALAAAPASGLPNGFGHAAVHAAYAAAPAAIGVADAGGEGQDATRVYDVRGAEAAAASAVPSAGEAAARSRAEPKRAAVVKRDTHARDLFASRVSPDELHGAQIEAGAAAMQHAEAAPSLDGEAGKRPGERNENSVLFSLAVLTKSTEHRMTTDSAAALINDDSGLIDLKALAAKTEAMRVPASMGDAALFSPPLGVMGSFGAGAGALSSPLGNAPRSRLPLWVGGGAIVAILLAAGIAIGTKIASGGSPAAPSAMAASPVAIPTETTGAPTESSAPASPNPSAAASASGSPKPMPRTTYNAPAPGVGGAAGPVVHTQAPPKAIGGSATAPADTGAAAGPAAPAKKAGSDCGCNGDLMCLMKCSTH
jgi:predicted Zn finger-like uncharacterized protein